MIGLSSATTAGPVFCCQDERPNGGNELFDMRRTASDSSDFLLYSQESSSICRVPTLFPKNTGLAAAEFFF